jgi:hypothetical protein
MLSVSVLANIRVGHGSETFQECFVTFELVGIVKRLAVRGGLSITWVLVPMNEVDSKEVILVSPQEEWINCLACTVGRGTLASNKNIIDMFELFKQTKKEALENLGGQLIAEDNKFLATGSARRSVLGLSDS